MISSPPPMVIVMIPKRCLPYLMLGMMGISMSLLSFGIGCPGLLMIWLVSWVVRVPVLRLILGRRLWGRRSVALR